MYLAPSQLYLPAIRILRMKKTMAVLIVLVVIGIGGCAISTSRAGTETPDYTILKKAGSLEVRQYKGLKLATTPMSGAEMNGSFMRLFRYIDGANVSQEKIAMTAPVLIEKKSDSATMSFIVPQAMATREKGIPQPSASEITVTAAGDLKVAALRFSGRRSSETEAKALEQLRKIAQEGGIELTGDALFAYYDPPWTPTFLRRNEVMLRVK